MLTFGVDLQDVTDVARKRQWLCSLGADALQTLLRWNQLAVLRQPGEARCRELLSGSILIRCELVRRRADAALDPADLAQPTSDRRVDHPAMRPSSH